MKKTFFIIGVMLCMMSCKPSIDEALNNLETAYTSGNENKAAKIWEQLWDRQNEMSMVQVERYVKLTEKYDPEWHYDDIDDGHAENQIDFYFANYRKEEPKQVKRSNSFSTGGNLAYYECRNCGLVVKSSSRPQPCSGICKDRFGKGNWSSHAWQRLCDVGTEHIVQCSKCGLELQCDKIFRVEGGCCRDGKSRHEWVSIY